MDGEFRVLASASPVEDGVEVYALTNINGKKYNGKRIIQGKSMYEINLAYEALNLICDEIGRELNKK